MRVATPLICVLLTAPAACSPGLSVTGATAEVSAAPGSRDCPKTFQLRGRITASSKGKAVYRWERSDGTKDAPHSVHFARRGTATVGGTWTVRQSLRGWARLHVLEPQDVTSPKADVEAECSATALATVAAVSPASSSRCRQRFVFTGKIAVSGPSKIAYRWERSDGTRTGRTTVGAERATTVTIRHVWDIGPRSYSGWARLDVSSPTRRTSNKATFTKALPCRG